ncbi:MULTISPECIES: GNAT family N-acetyltransferase [unclassified Streptomyces]|uniref:GNAT family N-acetyltransferase n=1 Tax=unclassified Streptomyces TaxID=2593676 RepID=UPI000CD5659D|nr:GNAT family protein [Streptomyces sp. SM10]
MTHEVCLRPVTDADLGLFEREFATEEGTGPYQWFGFTPAVGLRRRLPEDGLLGPDGGMLSVAADGETAGRIEWFRSSWGRPDTSSCWTVGIGLFPSMRGRGIGTEAQRRLLAYLFGHTRAERVQAWTDHANIAEQRALEKSGFVREGVLRRAQWRAGAWHDQVLYAALRGEEPR